MLSEPKINSFSIARVCICVSWLSASVGAIDQFLSVVCVLRTQSSDVLTAFDARVSVINGLVGIDFSLENAAGCFSSMELPRHLWEMQNCIAIGKHITKGQSLRFSRFTAQLSIIFPALQGVWTVSGV